MVASITGVQSALNFLLNQVLKIVISNIMSVAYKDSVIMTDLGILRHILTSIGMLGTTTMSSTSPAESSGVNLNILRWLKVIVLLSLIFRFTFSQVCLEKRTEHDHHLVAIAWLNHITHTVY
jgi:hypothetical protein